MWARNISPFNSKYWAVRSPGDLLLVQAALDLNVFQGRELVNCALELVDKYGHPDLCLLASETEQRPVTADCRSLMQTFRAMVCNLRPLSKLPDVLFAA